MSKTRRQVAEAILDTDQVLSDSELSASMSMALVNVLLSIDDKLGRIATVLEEAG